MIQPLLFYNSQKLRVLKQMKFKLLTLLLGLSFQLFAQSYTGDSYILFYRNSQTPVETALGGMSSLTNPSAYGHTVNPALLGKIKSNQLDATYRLNTFGLGGKDKYRSINLNYSLGDIGIFGFSYMHYKSSMNFWFTTLENPDGVGVYTPKMNLFSLSFARKFTPDFTAGLTVNYISSGLYYPEDKNYGGLDLGIVYSTLYKVAGKLNSKLTICGSLDNIVKFGEHDMNSRISTNEWSALPQSICLAISNEFGSEAKLAGKQLYNLNLQLQYSDEITSKVYTLYTVGTELTFLEMLTLRYAYSEGNNQTGWYFSANYDPKNTFGFGVALPVGEWMELDAPINLKLDYGHTFLRLYFDPTKITSDDFNTFSIGISMSN